MRLKLIRDGYEDYEYLKLLVERGAAAAGPFILWLVAFVWFESVLGRRRAALSLQSELIVHAQGCS